MFLPHPVREAIRSAGPVTNDTPIASSRKGTRMLMKVLSPFPRYFPVMSGMLRPLFRTEDGPETGDVEELYHKYLPHRHHLVVNAVGQGLSRGLSGAVRSEETVRKFPVKEESRHKQEDGNEKCYHCSQY